MLRVNIWSYTRVNLIKKIISLFIIAIMMIGLCSCSKGEQIQNDNLLIQTPSPQEYPAAGGSIRMYMPTNADLTDPLSVTTEEMLTMFSLVYEGLVNIDENANLVPALAENWSCDSSGKVWTIKLRSNAKWHDTGATINANDVIKTYERIVELGEETYYSYVCDKVQSIVPGADGTIVITMKNPGLASLYVLNFPIMRYGQALKSSIIGTGPYKAVSTLDENIIFKANENWWKQKPYIETIVFYSRDSNDIALASFAAGQLDFVPTSSLSVGSYREEGNKNVMDVMTQNVEIMYLNFATPSLKDVNVRKAIAYAIHRSKIITNVYMNRAHESDVPVAPDSILYDSKSKIYDYDVNKAKQLLETSGYVDIDGDGLVEKEGAGNIKLTLLINESSDAARKNAAELIKTYIENIGIQVEIKSAKYTLGNENSEYLNMLKNGEFDIALAGINIARNGDLTQLINSSGSKNYGKYNNSAMEKLAYNIISATDEASYRNAASQFQLNFVEELPFIVLYFRQNSILYSAQLKGIDTIREPDIMRTIDKWHIKTEIK